MRGIVVGLLVVALAAGCLVGCRSTTLPDGTQVVEMDIEQARNWLTLLLAIKESFEEDGVEEEEEDDYERLMWLIEEVSSRLCELKGVEDEKDSEE